MIALIHNGKKSAPHMFLFFSARPEHLRSSPDWDICDQVLQRGAACWGGGRRWGGGGGGQGQRRATSILLLLIATPSPVTTPTVKWDLTSPNHGQSCDLIVFRCSSVATSAHVVRWPSECQVQRRVSHWEKIIATIYSIWRKHFFPSQSSSYRAKRMYFYDQM